MNKEILCPSCTFLVKTEFQHATVNRCTYLVTTLKSYAIKCRDFLPSGLPSIRYMEQSAWLLTTIKKAGYLSKDLEFKPPLDSGRSIDSNELMQDKKLLPDYSR